MTCYIASNKKITCFDLSGYYTQGWTPNPRSGAAAEAGLTLSAEPLASDSVRLTHRLSVGGEYSEGGFFARSIEEAQILDSFDYEGKYYSVYGNWSASFSLNRFPYLSVGAFGHLGMGWVESEKVKYSGFVTKGGLEVAGSIPKLKGSFLADLLGNSALILRGEFQPTPPQIFGFSVGLRKYIN